jgi:hypothetical protein
VRLCLGEIDRCRPFFLGLLGERNGWVPPEADLARDPELLDRHPWVVDRVRAGCSLTELEIEHGVFRAATEPSAAFFYLRDPSHLAPQPGDASPEREEGPRQRLAALKRRLRAGPWACADYADPGSLGQQVLGDFTALLDRLYPAEDTPGPRQREAAAHRALADVRARGYAVSQVCKPTFSPGAGAGGGNTIIAPASPTRGAIPREGSWRATLGPH